MTDVSDKPQESGCNTTRPTWECGVNGDACIGPDCPYAFRHEVVYQQRDTKPVSALVGSKGTVFLTGGATLDHMKDGETVRMCESALSLDAEIAAAVSELQGQHLALYRLVYHHGGEGQCVDPHPHGECLSCDLNTLEDRWHAERAHYPMRSAATA